MATRTPVQIAKEIESIQALVAAGSLSDAAGRAAIEQLTRELVASASSPVSPAGSQAATAALYEPGPGGRGVWGGNSGQLFDDDLPAIDIREGDELDDAMGGGAGSRQSAEQLPRAEQQQIEALREGGASSRKGGRSDEGATSGAAPPPRAMPVAGTSRFTPAQVAFATFFGMFFAGSLLLASNAYDDRRPGRVLIRLLGFVLYVPAVIWAWFPGPGWLPVILVNAFFALLFSQVDPWPTREEPSWKVVVAVVGGWLAWWMFVLPLAGALRDVAYPPARVAAAPVAVGPSQEARADGVVAEIRAERPKVKGDCLPQYVGACVPPSPPDLDCKDVIGPVRVVGVDVHKLDRDGDGWACKSK
ncbi:hypothetical protein LBMAG42_54500 [Deltaproteobacteria bacterium]|nr:hypothetical protein LBMAG42_54500 [Deltaproteobacteria bacterium]